MRKTSAMGLVGGLLLLACGEAPPLEQAEAVGSVEEAVETAFDKPPIATSIEVHTASTELWVFACDTSGNLRRRVKASPAGAWGAWSAVTSGCADGLSAGTWPFADGTEQVFVYYRGNDNHLRQVWYASSSATPTISDISALSGVGSINGSPRVVDYGNCNNCGGTRWIHVAVRDSSNFVRMAIFDGTSWSQKPVLLGADPRAPTLVSSNTLGTLARPWVMNGTFIGSLTGRGINSSDDAFGWFARGMVIGSGTGWAMVESRSLEGTPTMGSNGTGPVLVWRKNGTIQFAAEGSSQVTTIPNCTVTGSPVSDNVQSGIGYVRGSGGGLMEYSVQAGNLHCLGRGGTLSSGVQPVSYNGNNQKALYKDQNGKLRYWDFVTNTHLDMNLFLL